MKDKNSCVICVISLVLHIPMSHSLKDKRKHVKSLKERIKNRFNASVAEIAALDDWQRAVIGISMISNDRRYLEKQYSLIENYVLETKGIELLSINSEWL